LAAAAVLAGISLYRFVKSGRRPAPEVDSVSMRTTKKLAALAAIPAALVIGLTACGGGSLSTSPSSTAAQNSTSTCLTHGDCTAAQQKQLAAEGGVTNADGPNGCLVVGNCIASQQKGIGAGSAPSGAPTQSTAQQIAAALIGGEDSTTGATVVSATVSSSSISVCKVSHNTMGAEDNTQEVCTNPWDEQNEFPVSGYGG